MTTGRERDDELTSEELANQIKLLKDVLEFIRPISKELAKRKKAAKAARKRAGVTQREANRVFEALDRATKALEPVGEITDVLTKQFVVLGGPAGLLINLAPPLRDPLLAVQRTALSATEFVAGLIAATGRPVGELGELLSKQIFGERSK